MRALVLHGPDDLRLQEVVDPQPGPGELVVRVEAALTCATDAKMLARGHHPALPPTPCPFGHEASGVVQAVGAGVTSFREGDAVALVNSAPCGRCRWCARGRPGLCDALTYMTGAFAERLRVPAAIVARNVLPRPAGMSAALAAMTEPVACGVRGAARSRARPGDCVVVLGAGVQGLTITGMLARRGCTVIACDPHERRRERSLRMGAALAVDAPRDAEGLAAVRELTPHERGADVVFAAVGDVRAWEQAVALAGPGGEVNMHGGPAPDSSLTLPASPLHYGEITIQASYHHDPESVRTALRMLCDADAPFAELLGPVVGLGDVGDVLRSSRDKHIVDPFAVG